MKRGGGKQKGASFERKVCEQLSRLVSPDTDETLFWRSSMSGGRATVRGKRGKKDATGAGDITCVHSGGVWIAANFFIECKFYAKLDIQSALLEGKGKLAAFWKIAVTEAKKHGKHPVLIARENRTRTIVLMNRQALVAWATYHPLKGCQLLHSDVLSATVYDFEGLMQT